jgi:hypothetical protein
LSEVKFNGFWSSNKSIIWTISIDDPFEGSPRLLLRWFIKVGDA